MLDKFQSFIREKELISSKSSVLLAISGGVDSMVMEHLFHNSPYNYAIAHCNFNLRGKESDGDEQFVRSLAKHRNIEFHTCKFETETYAKEKGISVQMAARELRFNWFEELANAHSYRNITIASHKSDELETILINITRGTGIAGLHGISPKKGKIIRPLLFAGKNEILDFAKNKNIQYREDSSNTSSKYVRNRIRNEVIPILKEINPSIEENTSKNISNIRAVETIYRTAIKDKWDEIASKTTSGFKIKIDQLLELSSIETWLYEWLRPFGFNSSHISDLVKTLIGQPGKRFCSATHQLVKDREHIILSPLSQLDNTVSIEANMRELAEPVKIKAETLKANGFSIPTELDTACIDKELLQFPLTLRNWKEGDYFHPLGMKGRKKLSDFLIDEKISLTEKDRTFVITSAKEVVWVVGHRLDERYKVTESTKHIYKMQLTE